MRVVAYPGRGKPPGLTVDLAELVVLLQGAYEASNVERWALDFGAPAAPAGVRASLRTHAFEVTVVDAFHRLARRYFQQRGHVGVWERPFPTGTRGRDVSIDVCMFNAAAASETRLELGAYSRAKLRNEADKLHGLRTQTEPGFGSVENYVALWEQNGVNASKSDLRTRMTRFRADALSVSTANPFTVLPLMASSMDLFVEGAGGRRSIVVALFAVT